MTIEPYVVALADLEVTELVRERLALFATRLAAANARTNLTGAKSVEAILDHVRDSLVLRPFIGESFVDVGAGGGFPGIPLAIVTGARALLIEAVLKKARFLERIVAELELSCEVVAARAEDVARDIRYRERFANATARAVASLPTVIELTVPFLQIGGSSLLQRGALTDDERVAASDAALVVGGAFVAEFPAGGERRVVVIEKRSPTTSRFPRRSGIPARRPLCVGA